jgi:hypothetical protein
MLMLEVSPVEVSTLLQIKRNKSYMTLADVSNARRKDISLNIAPL